MKKQLLVLSLLLSGVSLVAMDPLEEAGNRMGSLDLETLNGLNIGSMVALLPKELMLSLLRSSLSKEVYRQVHCETFRNSDKLTMDDLKVLLTVASNPVICVDNEDGNTLLHALAPFVKDPDMIRFLVAHGADRNAQNAQGKTPKKVAEESGNGEMVAIFEEEELPIAFDAGDFVMEQLSRLLELNSLASFFDKRLLLRVIFLQFIRDLRRTQLPSIKSFMFDSPEEVTLFDLKKLVAYDPEALRTWIDSPEGGNTVLHELAVFQYDPEMICFMLAHGADPNARNAEDQTPRDVAQDCGNHGMVAVLDEHADKTPVSDFDALSFLLDIDEQVSSGQRPEGMNPAKFDESQQEVAQQIAELFNAPMILPLGLLKDIVARIPKLVTCRDPQTGNTYLHVLAQQCQDEAILRFMIGHPEVDLGAVNNDNLMTVRDVAQAANNQVMGALLDEFEENPWSSIE